MISNESTPITIPIPTWRLRLPQWSTTGRDFKKDLCIILITNLNSPMSPDVIDIEKQEFKLEEKRLDAEKQARIVGLNTDEKMFPKYPWTIHQPSNSTNLGFSSGPRWVLNWHNRPIPKRTSLSLHPTFAPSLSFPSPSNSWPVSLQNLFSKNWIRLIWRVKMAFRVRNSFCRCIACQGLSIR